MDEKASFPPRHRLGSYMGRERASVVSVKTATDGPFTAWHSFARSEAKMQTDVLDTRNVGFLFIGADGKSNFRCAGAP
jgi:hypothetical protein